MRGDAALVEDRRHAQLVPEHRAVLAVVAQGDGDGLPALDGDADALDLGLRAIGALQVAAIAPDQLVQPISGDLLEGVVGEDERRVGLAEIGHGDAVRRHFERAAVDRVHAPEPPALGHVHRAHHPAELRPGRADPRRGDRQVGLPALAAQADGGAPLPGGRQQLRRGQRGEAAPRAAPRREAAADRLAGASSKRRKKAALA